MAGQIPNTTSQQREQECLKRLDRWCAACKAEARRDPLRFHSNVVPKLLGEIAATIIPDDNEGAKLARLTIDGKRACLSRWSDAPIQECARTWYQRRQQQRALVVAHARHEFADDPPPELTGAEIAGANRTPAETRTAHRKEYRLAKRRKRASKWSDPS